MELFWWAVAIILMAIGILGTILPVFPGAVIILGAAGLHRFMLGPEKSIGWPTLALLAFLAAASYAIDFLAGWLGARHFGATRWGMWGAFCGAIVGLFFALPGLLFGPIIGTLVGELIAGKRLIDAGRASWGALLGNLGALLGKLALAFTMVACFLLAAPAPF